MTCPHCGRPMRDVAWLDMTRTLFWCVECGALLTVRYASVVGDPRPVADRLLRVPHRARRPAPTLYADPE